LHRKRKRSRMENKEKDIEKHSDRLGDSIAIY
jgi:hypothetical protein